jgi:hypothetical protein
MKPIKLIISALALLWASLAQPSISAAQGTLSIALTQQFAFTNCASFTNTCGTPLAGGLLFFYQAGTVATQQNSFQDTALTLVNPWPLQLDANGRVPAFYLLSGSIHVRLTDASGVVQFDYPNMLVIGPSGGGGGGASVDPTTVMSTGDIKFRATSEFVTGWVKLNGQTIGSTLSGASGRANSDTQAAFVYLWTNCPDAHCPVLSGRGGSALADFTANKQLTLLDWRSRGPVGLDDMGNSAAGRLLAANVTSGGGDGVTTPGATGGEANHTMSVAELAAHTHTNSLTDPGHSHNAGTQSPNVWSSGANGAVHSADNGGAGTFNSGTATTGITITNASAGSGTPFNNMSPFMLGTWYLKL